MKKYEIVVYWSDEERVFVAEVPKLPGCAARGGTRQSALLNVREAISLWIESCKSDHPVS